MFRITVVFCLVVASHSSSLARTWTVDRSGGGDFVDIQSAVDAAVDGDVILVRATGDYLGFSCSKGVTIRAESGQFDLENWEWITLRNSAPGTAMSLSGVACYDTSQIFVDSCAGEVVLENISFVQWAFWVCCPAIEIDGSSNVSLSHSSLRGGFRDGDFGGLPGRVHIHDSAVRISQVEIVGLRGWKNLGGMNGEDGLWIGDSYVEIATSTVTGGIGMESYINKSGADGGRGVYVEDSMIVILGASTDCITGGDGGPGTPIAMGGNGGDGLVISGSTVQISGVQLKGGRAGYNGRENGNPYSGGTPSRNDVLPFLELDRELVLLGAATATIQCTEPGRLFLMASNRGGFVPGAGTIGPQLSVLPGPGFVFLAIGRTDAAGFRAFPFALPGDAILIGQPLNLQSLFVGDSGTRALSNSTTRVIGS